MAVSLPTPPNPSSAVNLKVIGVKSVKSIDGDMMVRYLRSVFTSSISGPLTCSQLKVNLSSSASTALPTRVIALIDGKIILSRPALTTGG